MLFVGEDTNNDSQEATFSDENTPLSEAQATLNDFWPTITDEIKRIKTVDAKNQVLPLARIKKIMKLDEDVKMISAEAPLLFAKAAEVFIQELTLRAWVHTEDNKRRTLQRNDIAMAITKFDQFDFLIDIVPREEVKPVKKENETKPLVNCDQVQYYLQLAQQHQQALQGTNGITAQQVQQPGTTIQMQGQNVTQPITLAAPQNILVTNAGTPTVVGGIQQGQQTQQIQLVQQIVTPNGEITHVPINIPQNQLNLLRMQIQNQAAQPIILQAAPIQSQQILQVGQAAAPTTGGDLIDAFQSGGQFAVENLIREQFGVFLYNNGKGQMINRAEYLRWKYRENKEVVIPIEASLSPHDPLGKWVDHKAGWQMQYRGSLGESLLHVLIICDTKIHTKLARILLRVFSILALDVMEGEEYLGASALHLSIAYSNNELVQDLIEAGANVNQRATGSFFLPRDQQGYRPAKNTDYEGLAYLGEYPLAWAACCANESVYNLLLDSGADPDAQDTFGNMILHMVVVCDKLDMFGYALRHPKLPAKNGIINDSGLTPLTLACKLGRAEVFREMLELSSREFWRYSNITCSGYPLNALDTLLPDGRTNWNSALFIILNGTKEEHLDMLDGGIIQRLLEEKWKTFARNQFLKRLLILFIHLFFLSISMYLRPATENLAMKAQQEEEDLLKADSTSESSEEVPTDEMDIQTYIRYGSEVCTLLGVLSYIIFQQGDEIKNQGLAAFTKQLVHTPAKAIFLMSNILILACIPFRIIGDNDTEEAILVFAVPGSWFLLMFFAGAVRLTGPFVTMIYSMITGDMFTFGIIYLIVLFGFSQAFYFLYKGHPQVKSSLFYTYPSTWMALFQTTLGDYSYSDLNNTTYPNLAKTVFVIFMIFVPILLLNMLIAMMGNTYAHVIEQSEKEWMKQWAKIVVTLERAVAQTDAQKYLEAYSIPLGPSDDSGYETRGVMVIKSKSKTRAKQRKGAVSNWKRVGKVTLNALHKRGLTGEELRRIMWGRASISSPTKEPKKKLRDPNDPFDVSTGGALSSALDVMSFAHDIVMCNDPPTTTQTKDHASKSNTQVTNQLGQPLPKNEQVAARPSTVGSSITANDQQILQTNNSASLTQLPNFQATERDYKDPLRELVLISEAICINDTAYLTNVNSLAKEASVLEHVKEVLPEQAGQMPV
ncbi:Nuclear transcription factor Y subunit gamma, partial [Pseudolycoriella hygida]